MAMTVSSGIHTLLFLCVFLFSGGIRMSESGPFKFSIHHRFSDVIKGIFDSEGVPEKHSPGYYAAMVHRDRLVRGRRLATNGQATPLTFLYGNVTYRLNSLGFLYYANVSVGTPMTSFLVALDTGSDLFWLPCDCPTCITHLNTTDGRMIKLNHYSPNASTTSKYVACSSPLCELGNQCSSPTNTCPYQIQYLSANTSTTGYLVEDLLHLATNDDSKSQPVDARITLGCGRIQTGAFTKNGAPNGLLGLGMEGISIPSLLASQGLISDSFSMCFAIDGIGNIEFGDTATLVQSQTSIIMDSRRRHQSYNVRFTQINVGGRLTNLTFSAIFDSGTSFTYLNDPVYSLIAEQIDAGMNLQRYFVDSDFPFEYCYKLLPNERSYEAPMLNFTMSGGDIFGTLRHFVAVRIGENTYAVCLGITKSTDSINLIGQNFMSGYRIVFNREKMTLGWTESDCGSDNGSGTPPSSKSPPANSPPPRANNSYVPLPEPPSPPPQIVISGGGGNAEPLNLFSCIFTLIFAFWALV